MTRVCCRLAAQIESLYDILKTAIVVLDDVSVQFKYSHTVLSRQLHVAHGDVHRAPPCLCFMGGLYLRNKYVDEKPTSQFPPYYGVLYCTYHIYIYADTTGCSVLCSIRCHASKILIFSTFLNASLCHTGGEDFFSFLFICRAQHSYMN